MNIEFGMEAGANATREGREDCDAHSKFQIVFDIDEHVEMHMLLDGVMHKTSVDLGEAPFSVLALQDENVRAALKEWMTAARAPVWMSWLDLEQALAGASISVQTLAEAYPPIIAMAHPEAKSA